MLLARSALGRRKFYDVVATRSIQTSSFLSLPFSNTPRTIFAVQYIPEIFSNVSSWSATGALKALFGSLSESMVGIGNLLAGMMRTSSS
jgi:hypothetical protein